jgi:hypothetical protein
MTKNDIIELVFNAVEIVTGMQRDQYSINSRKREYTFPRFLVQWYLLTYKITTSEHIARLVGKTNPSTVYHGRKFIDIVIETKDKEDYPKVEHFRSLMKTLINQSCTDQQISGEITPSSESISLWYRDYKIKYDNKKLLIFKDFQIVFKGTYMDLTVMELKNLIKKIVNDHIQSVSQREPGDMESVRGNYLASN